MKTPDAILISLSLIAAVIFFKDTMTPPAHAFGGPDGFGCNRVHCFVFKGDTAIHFHPGYGANDPWLIFNWRTGETIK